MFNNEYLFSGDNYSNLKGGKLYVYYLECIGSEMHMPKCNSFLCCGDWSTALNGIMHRLIVYASLCLGIIVLNHGIMC